MLHASVCRTLGPMTPIFKPGPTTPSFQTRLTPLLLSAVQNALRSVLLFENVMACLLDMSLSVLT